MSPASGALVLDDRQEVGEDLARVELVGEGVDDGHARVRRHLLDPVLAVGPPHDGLRTAGQDAGDVGDRLADPTWASVPSMTSG